ncbi:hypothetical protein IKF67_00975 [Candidatus Saccharibacteria bacterium]|nr:hypothetical protein [Candidatus Saccharibacteria bacterium]
METEGNLYNIVDGPDRDALFDACKYAYDYCSFISVEFKVAIGLPPRLGGSYEAMKIKDIRISRVGHENGSDVGLNLEGTCKADLNPHSPVAPEWRNYKFKAYYNAKRKTGFISFFE